ncbi:hypothetical protein PHLGIDRAFT_182585 [Phlebiopsis gigantea 11061_1 CR5-6]|uniref:B30.2/SPRY domain-containing protein n=1 Tax=Phlebiopsis gigantea (strain 11061_1 CR5-6) TaxID=745531 RepID=A0A0C3NIJ0_PHLG1|nr:hypothetical protein PHLGIDRAFT_182585 [Phlebiopsis gigantea 11061_1 CR5-6]
MDPQLQERLPVASVLSGFPYAAACLSTIWYCGTKCLSNIYHPTEWMCLGEHRNVDLFQIVDGDRREVTIMSSIPLRAPTSETTSSLSGLRCTQPFDSAYDLCYYETNILTISPSSWYVYIYPPSTTRSGRLRYYVNSYFGIGMCIRAPNRSGFVSFTFYNDGTIILGENGHTHRMWRYGSYFDAGDVVGCGIRKADMVLFFCRNGVPLGNAVLLQDVPELSGLLGRGPYVFCPELRLASPPVRISISSNFGQKPFFFNISRRGRLAAFEVFARMLPQEVVELIQMHASLIHTPAKFREKHGTQPKPDRGRLSALSRFSLVSKDWSRQSRPQLFKRIVLSMPNEVNRFRDLLINSPPPLSPSSLVTQFSVIDAAASQHSPLFLLSQLPRQLSKVSLLDCSIPEQNLNSLPPRLRMLLPNLFRLFGSLTHLVLRHYHFQSVNDFLRLVISAQNLQVVILIDAWAAHNMAPQADQALNLLSSKPRQLHCIELVADDNRRIWNRASTQSIGWDGLTHRTGRPLIDCYSNMLAIVFLLVGPNPRPSRPKAHNEGYHDHPAMVTKTDMTSISQLFSCWVHFISSSCTQTPSSICIELLKAESQWWIQAQVTTSVTQDILPYTTYVYTMAISLTDCPVTTGTPSAIIDEIQIQFPNKRTVGFGPPHHYDYGWTTFNDLGPHHYGWTTFLGHLDQNIGAFRNFPRIKCGFENIGTSLRPPSLLLLGHFRNLAAASVLQVDGQIVERDINARNGDSDDSYVEFSSFS